LNIKVGLFTFLLGNANGNENIYGRTMLVCDQVTNRTAEHQGNRYRDQL